MIEKAATLLWSRTGGWIGVPCTVHESAFHPAACGRSVGHEKATPLPSPEVTWSAEIVTPRLQAAGPARETPAQYAAVEAYSRLREPDLRRRPARTARPLARRRRVRRGERVDAQRSRDRAGVRAAGEDHAEERGQAAGPAAQQRRHRPRRGDEPLGAVRDRDASERDRRARLDGLRARRSHDALRLPGHEARSGDAS